MKKSLGTKSKSIFISVFVLIVLSFQHSFALEPLDSYKQLFESWGFEIDTVDLEQEVGDDEDYDLSNLGFGRKDNDKYLLALTSQEYLSDDSYSNVIIICDNSLLSGSNFPVDCTPSTLDDFDFRTTSTKESTASYKISGIVNPIKIDSTNYYFIPEILMVTPDYREVLANHFKALSKTDDIKIGTKDPESQVDLVGQLKNIKDSMSFETASYATFLFVFVVVSAGLLKILVLNPRDLLKKDVYRKQFDRFLAFLKNYHGIFTLSLFVLAFLYIPIIYALQLRGSVLGIYEYPYLYIKNTLLPTNYRDIVMAKNIFKIGFLLYNYILGVLILLVAIPKSEPIISVSVSKFRSVRLKNVFVKWLMPSVIVVNMILLGFFEIEELIGFLSLSIVILFLAFTYIKSRSIEFAGLFKKKEIAVVSLVMVVVLIFDFIYPIYKQQTPIRYANEPLIGSGDDVVLFPYSKKWGENVLFEPHFYNGDSEIFADSYLVHSLPAKKVINKPLNQFNNENSVIILSGTPSEVVEALFEKSEIVNYLATGKFSSFFTVDLSDKSDLTTATIQINCQHSPNSSTLTMDIYSKDSEDRGGKVNKSKIDALKFPGCEPDSVTKFYEVPIDSYLLPDQKLFIVLGGLDEQTLIDFRLFGGGVEIPATFLKNNILDENIYSIVYKSPVIGNDLYAYSTRVKEEVSFDMNFTEEGFDLSEPINDLMKHGFLNNPFIIWSSGGVEIIDR